MAETLEGFCSIDKPPYGYTEDELDKEILNVLLKIENRTNYDAINALFPHLSNEDKLRIGIFTVISTKPKRVEIKHA